MKKKTIAKKPDSILRATQASYYADASRKDLQLQSHGKFGQTFIGWHTDIETPVVIKKIIRTQPSFYLLQREHRWNFNIARLLTATDYADETDAYYIIRPYAEGINLKHFIEKKHIKQIGEKSFLEAWIDLLYDLEKVHASGVVHCDIKPVNIIVSPAPPYTREQKINLYLTDFGLARLQSEEIAHEKRVPFALIYSPPEQLLNVKALVTPASDVFSAGISLYEVLSGNSAFSNSNPEFLMNLQLNSPLPIHGKIPEDLMNILKKATARYRFTMPPNRQDRSHVAQLLKSGQKKRFESAGAFAEALVGYVAQIPEKEQSLFRRLFGDLL